MSSQTPAVGKSTFARLLQSSCPDWEVVAEPVSKWQNIETSKVAHISWPPYLFSTAVIGDQADHLRLYLWQGTDSNLLQMMYQDPQRWSYTFQTYSCMSRLRTQLQPPPARMFSSMETPVQVYERSVYSDRWLTWGRTGKSNHVRGNFRPIIIPIGNVLISSLPKLFQPECGRELCTYYP